MTNGNCMQYDLDFQNLHHSWVQTIRMEQRGRENCNDDEYF